MNGPVFRFCQREVDLARRQVKVDGQLRAIEPRAFDLLAYLIEHRHRVVPKDELLDTVWQHECVSVGSVARAVMKARQALRDNGEPALISTLPRVGYRFVAPLESTMSATAQGGDTRTSHGRQALSIALLPLRNLTGESELDWVELGMMSLICSALRHDARLSPISTQSLLIALEGMAASDSQIDKAAAVQRLTGARHVVSASIAREGVQYRLDYQLLTMPWTGARALYGAEPTELGWRLARDVASALLPGMTHPAANAFHFSDPLANQAFARAQQAAGEQKWQSAIHLLKVVLDLEPDSGAAQLEYLRALAAVGDVGADVVAQRLLTRAMEEHDVMLVAAVHQTIGRTHLNRGAFRAARFHLEQALLLAAGRETSDWTAQTLLLLASAAVHERNFADAEKYLDRVQHLCGQSGNQIFLMARTNMLAVMAGASGDSVRSLQLSSEVVRLAREQRVHRYFLDACANAAQDAAALGMLKDATAYAEEGLATARALGDRIRTSNMVAVLCLVYRQSGAIEASARVLASLPSPEGEVNVMARESLLRAHGHHAASAGEHALAADCFQDAMRLLRDTKNSLMEHETLPWLLTSSIQAGRMDEVARELARAEHPPYTEDAELRVALQYCRAHQAFAEDRSELALTLLEEVVRTAPQGYWHACACADAGWLLAESGFSGEAQAMLGRLGQWFRDHPPSIAVDARTKHAAGDFTAAHAAHCRYLAAVGSAAPEYFRQLSDGYAASATADARGPRAPLAAAPSLPSAL